MTHDQSAYEILISAWRLRADLARARSVSAKSEHERDVQIGMAAVWTAAANELVMAISSVNELAR